MTQVAFLWIDFSFWSIMKYVFVILTFFAFQKAFEHWKWEATRPTLSVTRPTKEQSLLTLVLANAKSGDPASVLSTVDTHCWSSPRNWMMNVGDVKGLILDAELKRAIAARKPAGQPFTVLELGTYTGYASVRIARWLDAASGDRLLTVELDAAAVRIAQQIVRHAGLSDRVTLINGDAALVIPELKTTYRAPQIDFVFIDHWKELYLPHFKLLQQSGVMHSGTVIVADNVIYPGAPKYLEYVRAQSNLTSVFHDTFLEYTTERDGVEVTTVN